MSGRCDATACPQFTVQDLMSVGAALAAAAWYLTPAGRSHPLAMTAQVGFPHARARTLGALRCPVSPYLSAPHSLARPPSSSTHLSRCCTDSISRAPVARCRSAHDACASWSSTRYTRPPQGAEAARGREEGAMMVRVAARATATGLTAVRGAAPLLGAAAAQPRLRPREHRCPASSLPQRTRRGVR